VPLARSVHDVGLKSKQVDRSIDPSRSPPILRPSLPPGSCHQPCTGLRLPTSAYTARPSHVLCALCILDRRHFAYALLHLSMIYIYLACPQPTLIQMKHTARTSHFERNGRNPRRAWRDSEGGSDRPSVYLSESVFNNETHMCVQHTRV
jgi:hypothetical protein